MNLFLNVSPQAYEKLLNSTFGLVETRPESIGKNGLNCIVMSLLSNLTHFWLMSRFFTP